MFPKNTRIYVAGHSGMVGSSILRALKKKGYKNLIYTNSNKLDLRDQNKTLNFLKKTRPQVVIIASAKVGGIMSNSTYRADFISDNLSIQNNLIIGSHKSLSCFFLLYLSLCPAKTISPSSTTANPASWNPALTPSVNIMLFSPSLTWHSDDLLLVYDYVLVVQE